MLEIRENVPSIVNGATETFVIADLPGFADFAAANRKHNRTYDKERKWLGGMDHAESLKCVREGDLSGVAPSDRLLTAVEHLVPVTRAWESYVSVVGGSPIVPQYLAGNPLCMRNRRRVSRETAPLSVFVDLVASAGITADQCRQRGTAILALTRLLANVRPVELWVVIAGGSSGKRVSECIKMDTAPLDLARAAHVLTHPSVFRALGYRSISSKFYNGNWGGDWAFRDPHAHRRTAAETYKAVLCPAHEVLYIPAIHISDQSITDPTQWLREKLTEFGGLPVE